ncbi:MAG: chromosome segregation ATPase [Xenococcus sp. MO_188.B8]|nr:chromosome segregation ATPase [Xenococcus sp. MO_188.B8]
MTTDRESASSGNQAQTDKYFLLEEHDLRIKSHDENGQGGEKFPAANSLKADPRLPSKGEMGQQQEFDYSGSDNLPLPVTKPTNTLTNPQSNSPKLMTTESSPRSYWWQTWQMWGIVLVLLSGGIGYGATSMLLRLPQTKSCSNVFWPVASAAVRIYCAQNLASQKTVADYLSAIALVEELPPDHPLRSEINRNVEKWATGILNIGETKFQEGNLEAAIAIAKEIPDNVEAKKIVDSKIETWETVWSKGDRMYNQVGDYLRDSQWNEAFSAAVRLTDIRNSYWSTTKYQEAIDNINIAQEESAVLDQAFSQLKEGSLDNLFAAVKKAQAIPENSYAYEDAQDILTQGKDRIFALTDEYLAKRNWLALLNISYKVPGDILGIEELVGEWKIIANAGRSADLGSVLNLEDAIAEAATLPPEANLYNQAQQLISRWTLEIEDVKHFDQAKELAQGGKIPSYRAAITELKLIPAGNPRYQDAQKQIIQWRGEIQIIEDRPIIARAREIAAPSTVTDWRRAIAEINLVSSTSPLYPEAKRYARRWRTSIERVEDQPILDQAISLANQRNYNGAIQIARQIGSGRALSKEAQGKINLWQQEINAREYLRQSRILADQRTPDSLAQAIETIRKISTTTSLHYQVLPNVNDWSTEMVVLAERASYSSLREAIEIARKIPAGTTGYNSAQNLIAAWEQRLNPTPFLEKKAKSVIDLKPEKNKPEN